MEEFINNIHFTSIGWAIIFPVILIILDVLTGVINAWKDNDFQSAKMRAGLSKKFAEIVYILVGILTKYAIGSNIFLYFMVGYISFMEISSIFENCDKLGLKIPEKIKEKINNESEVR